LLEIWVVEWNGKGAVQARRLGDVLRMNQDGFMRGEARNWIVLAAARNYQGARALLQGARKKIRESMEEKDAGNSAGYAREMAEPEGDGGLPGGRKRAAERGPAAGAGAE